MYHITTYTSDRWHFATNWLMSRVNRSSTALVQFASAGRKRSPLSSHPAGGCALMPGTARLQASTSPQASRRYGYDQAPLWRMISNEKFVGGWLDIAGNDAKTAAKLILVCW